MVQVHLDSMPGHKNARHRIMVISVTLKRSLSSQQITGLGPPKALQFPCQWLHTSDSEGRRSWRFQSCLSRPLVAHRRDRGHRSAGGRLPGSTRTGCFATSTPVPLPSEGPAVGLAPPPWPLPPSSLPVSFHSPLCLLTAPCIPSRPPAHPTALPSHRAARTWGTDSSDRRARSAAVTAPERGMLFFNLLVYSPVISYIKILLHNLCTSP